MGVCIFVASGLDFDVDRYLKSSPFKTMSVFRKGQIPPQDNPGRQPRPDSGFATLVTADAQPDLSKTLPEAIAFLSKREQELERLNEVGVDNMLLDLGISVDVPIQQVNYLSPELIMALGRFRMGLILSVIQLPRG
jgi:hypothetical protein